MFCGWFWGLFVGFGWVFGCGGVCFRVGCVVMACLKGFYASKQQVFRNPLYIGGQSNLEGP